MKKIISMLAICALSLFSHHQLQAQSAVDHEDQSGEYDLYDRNLDNADFNKYDYPNEQMYRDNSSGPYRAPSQPKIQTQMTQIPSSQNPSTQTQKSVQRSQNGEYNLSGSTSSNANVNSGNNNNSGSYNSGSYNPNNQNNGSYYYYDDSYRYQNNISPTKKNNVETPLEEISNDRSNGPYQAQNQPQQPQQQKNGQIAARDNEYNLYDRNRDRADWNRNDYPNSNYYYYNSPR